MPSITSHAFVCSNRASNSRTCWISSHVIGSTSSVDEDDDDNKDKGDDDEEKPDVNDDDDEDDEDEGEDDIISLTVDVTASLFLDIDGRPTGNGDALSASEGCLHSDVTLFDNDVADAVNVTLFDAVSVVMDVTLSDADSVVMDVTLIDDAVVGVTDVTLFNDAAAGIVDVTLQRTTYTKTIQIHAI